MHDYVVRTKTEYTAEFCFGLEGEKKRERGESFASVVRSENKSDEGGGREGRRRRFPPTPQVSSIHVSQSRRTPTSSFTEPATSRTQSASR